MNITAIIKKLSSHFANHHQQVSDNSEVLSRQDNKIYNCLCGILSEELEEVEIDYEIEIKDENFNFEEELKELEKTNNNLKYAPEIWKEIVHKFFDLKWKFSTIQHAYRKILHRGEIYAYRNYLETGGTKYFKIHQLKKQMFEKLKNARNTNLPIHDMDLKRWALEIARSLGLSRDEFLASDLFIYNFKKKFGIVSRKITKFVNRRDFTKREELEDRAIIFT